MEQKKRPTGITILAILALIGGIFGVIGGIAIVWAVLFSPQLFAGRVYVLGDAAAYRQFAEFSRARWLETHERTF